MEFRGIFKELKDFEIEDMNICDLYESYFAKFYENMSIVRKEELELYLTSAYVTGGTVLELACGNGRISTEMIKNGIKLIGIDNSEDMLNIFREKVIKMPKRLRNNVKIYNQDIFNLNIEEKINMVMLPATTICLFVDKLDELAKTFNYIYDKLEKGGRMVFDYISDFTEGNEKTELKMRTRKYGDREEITFLQEFRNFEKKEAIINLYVETIENGKTERYLASSSKSIVLDETINELISKTKFKVIDTVVMCDDSVGKIKYVVLEK